MKARANHLLTLRVKRCETLEPLVSSLEGSLRLAGAKTTYPDGIYEEGCKVESSHRRDFGSPIWRSQWLSEGSLVLPSIIPTAPREVTVAGPQKPAHLQESLG